MQATVIYTRISKDREGAGLGVDRQRADCEELAQRLGWTVVATYTDNDLSAYSGKPRPGYEAMCQALKDGRAQTVIAWHTDRLHRRPVELESFIDLCDAQRIDVRTVKAGVVDLSTASGKMVARMLGAAARHEVDHMVERSKRAKEQAAMDGKFRGGRRSFGYEANGTTARADEAAAIRKATDDVRAGVSLRQIARDWNAAGLRTAFGGKAFTSREVRKILLRPRNAGISLHEGKQVAEGKWDRIIDPETYETVKAILCAPGRGGGNYERKHQGTGVYRCGKCGAHMVGGAHNPGPDGWRRTYKCSATNHLARDVEYLDAYVDEIVIGALSRPDAQIRLGGQDLAELQRQHDGLRARLDDLTRMFTRGEIDADQLKAGSADLHTQLARIDAQIAAARSASALADLVLAGNDLRATWAAMSPDIRGAVIDTLVTVTVMPGARGRKPGGGYFDPSTVRVEWKSDTA